MIVEIGSGALALLPSIVDGRCGVVASPRTRTALRGLLPGASWVDCADGSVRGAVGVAARLSGFDVVVGIGGGRVLDVAKYAAAHLGVPVVTCPTSLSHDGIASAVSTLFDGPVRRSHDVAAPIAVVADLAVIRAAPPRYLRAGVGEVLSNLSAVEDWALSRRHTGEHVDGHAVALARASAQMVGLRTDTLDTDAFLLALAEALVLSGTSMVVAGSSRPCSGACHKISHAIDEAFPAKARLHGEQVGVSAAFATYLRGNSAGARNMVETLAAHGLPAMPGDLGLTGAEFASAVVLARKSKPDRFTVLEHLALGDADVRDAVEQYALEVPTCSPL